MTLTELMSPEMNGDGFVEYAKGYFRVPVAGNYVFRLMCNSEFQMKISKIRNQGDLTNNFTLLLNQNSKNLNDSNVYLVNNETVSQISFDREGYYAFELVHLQRKSFFRIEV